MPSPTGGPHKSFLFYQPSPDRPLPLWMLFPVFFVAIYLSHITLLRLPYYWDEAGYYIPAAYDFFRTGSLIPHSTLSNAHPPLPSVLLAAWWSFAGYVPSATRTLMCMIASIALLGVYQLSRLLTNTPVAIVTTLLTALYPVWFAQSSLAHADMFAAAATMWALATYFRSLDEDHHRASIVFAAMLFSIAALAKETAIVNAIALAAWEIARVIRKKLNAREGITRAAILSAAALPLTAWFIYYRHKTGFIFGNPEYLRYNATATLTPLRVLLAFAHRVFHAAAHMNMFVPTICMIAAMFLPPRVELDRSGVHTARPAASHRPVMFLIILINLILFSLIGGALLTRYLLPVYPLVLLAAVATWWRRVPHWGWLAGFAGVAFFLGLIVNPPYRFAPEDNLAYRDMIVLHQHAATRLMKSPTATVLTAWPANAELGEPWLGYVKQPIKTVSVDNFTREQLAAASDARHVANLAFLFSTKYAPAALPFHFGQRNEQWEQGYFGFHQDLTATEAATMLGGKVIWYEERKGQWAALLALPPEL